MNTTISNTYSNNSSEPVRTMQEAVKPGDAIYTRSRSRERLTVRVVSDNIDGAVFVCDAADGRVCVVMQREVLAHFMSDANAAARRAESQRSLF